MSELRKLSIYRNGKIRTTVKPRELYLEFDLTRVWFKNRIRNRELGELIMRRYELIITVRKQVEESAYHEKIGWDLNLFSIDGFSPKYGWIKIDLSKIYHAHKVHEVKKGMLSLKQLKSTL